MNCVLYCCSEHKSRVTVPITSKDDGCTTLQLHKPKHCHHFVENVEEMLRCSRFTWMQFNASHWIRKWRLSGSSRLLCRLTCNRTSRFISILLNNDNKIINRAIQIVLQLCISLHCICLLFEVGAVQLRLQICQTTLYANSWAFSRKAWRELNRYIEHAEGRVWYAPLKGSSSICWGWKNEAPVSWHLNQGRWCVALAAVT